MFRNSNDAAISLQLRGKRFLSGTADRVVDTALIVQFGVHLFLRLLDQSSVDHATERAVKRSWPHFHLTLRVHFDLLHNAVAVPFFRRKREQDMQHRGSEWSFGVTIGHGVIEYIRNGYMSSGSRSPGRGEARAVFLQEALLGFGGANQNDLLAGAHLLVR